MRKKEKAMKNNAAEARLDLKKRSKQISKNMSKKDKEDFKAMVEDFIDELDREQS